MIAEHSNPGRTGKKVWATYSPHWLPIDAVHVVCEAPEEPVHLLSIACWCGPQILDSGVWTHPRGKKGVGIPPKNQPAPGHRWPRIEPEDRH